MTVDACERWEEQLSALLDGELSEAERRELADHLTGCAACRAYLADLTAIHGAMETVPAPEGFTRLVMDRVERTEQAGRKRSVPWRRWGLLAACCALAALGVWQLRSDTVLGADAALPAGAARSAVMGGGDEESWSDSEDMAENTVADEDTPTEVQVEGPMERCGGEEKAAPAAEFSAEAEAGEAEGAVSPQAEACGPELTDCETASERFGHQLVPCAAENFQGYSLGWAGDGQGGEAVCTNVDYLFSNGWVQIRDQDRVGGSIDLLLLDAGGVVYGGKTFYVKDASGYTSVQYFPNGESGLSYSACFVSEMEQNEVFELLLSLEIS